MSEIERVDARKIAEIAGVDARRRSVAAASSAVSPTAAVAERASLGQVSMVHNNLDSHPEPEPKKAAVSRDSTVTGGCADRTRRGDGAKAAEKKR
jgi:hypothetical protein